MNSRVALRFGIVPVHMHTFVKCKVSACIQQEYKIGRRRRKDSLTYFPILDSCAVGQPSLPSRPQNPAALRARSRRPACVRRRAPAANRDAKSQRLLAFARTHRSGVGWGTWVNERLSGGGRGGESRMNERNVLCARRRARPCRGANGRAGRAGAQALRAAAARRLGGERRGRGRAGAGRRGACGGRAPPPLSGRTALREAAATTTAAVATGAALRVSPGVAGPCGTGSAGREVGARVTSGRGPRRGRARAPQARGGRTGERRRVDTASAAAGPSGSCRAGPGPCFGLRPPPRRTRPASRHFPCRARRPGSRESGPADPAAPGRPTWLGYVRLPGPRRRALFPGPGPRPGPRPRSRPEYFAPSTAGARVLAGVLPIETLRGQGRKRLPIRPRGEVRK